MDTITEDLEPNENYSEIGHGAPKPQPPLEDTSPTSDMKPIS
jgi:hypothetical protein